MLRTHTTLLLAGAALGSQLSAATSPPVKVEFNRDIRPLLADACFHCHGPDPGTRKAGLRLDTEAGFFTPAEPGTSPTIVKNDPEKSPLYQRLTTTDTDDIMPPPESHKTLKPEQIALVRQWIAEGAPWQPHWSFISPTLPTPPEVKQKEWVRNPIDTFVLATLEQKGLAPAPEADRHTLARRAALDITGLPPEPAELETFLKDTSADAYEQYVDRLMKSERYGEHRARYWLDAARYADTHGLHFDKYREMWPYRDWVVQSFNRNQPFDQFTVEQLAGDLLPNPTESQLIATGLQRCNITTNEGGTIDEENLANYAADRVQTLGWIYMGLTANCSQCHDHKFDPITQKDYYALAAFFRNTTQGPKDGNVKDSGPILVLPEAKDRPRWDVLPQEIASATIQRDSRKIAAKPDFNAWLASAKPESLDADIPAEGLIAHVPLNEGVGSEVTGICGASTKFRATGEVSWRPDGKIGPAPVMKLGGTFDLGPEGDFEKTDGFSYGGWIRADRAGVYGGIIAKMDEKDAYKGWDLFQADRSLAVHIVSKWPTDALKVSTKKPVLKPGQWQHVMVTYDGTSKPGGVKIYIDGVMEPLKTDTDGLQGSIRTATHLRVGQRSGNQVFDGGSLQDVRVYKRALTVTEIQALHSTGPLRATLAATATNRTPAQQNALYDYYLNTRDAEYKLASTTLQKLDAERTAIRGRSAVTHIQEEKKNSPAMANILMRGQYDQVGAPVEAAVPVALGKLAENSPKNRLGLAEWLVRADNPLTTRVTVNRFWQELFGQGLVKTPDDFGIMGAAPTHPELLDWLAVDFREHGWDVKRFYRQMLTSAAYRQAATTTPEKLEKDRDNALVSRGPRFRMDAEMVRDYALAASSTLSPRMGGPGTKPYQPENIWEVVGLGTEKYSQDKGENLYRRTLYNFWKRMAPSPNMETFNAPNREVSCVRRDRTNTPLQALVTLNDPQFVEAARSLAQHTLATTGTDRNAAIRYISTRLLSRELRPEEAAIVIASLEDLTAHYKANPADAKALLEVGESKLDPALDMTTLAAWTMLCNQMMNLDEVLNK
jgi:mono/diheme cytochrome c family protein